MQRLRFLFVIVITALALAVQPAAAQSSTPASEYDVLTIAGLRARSYGAGEFAVERTLQVTDAFTRTLIRFDSDGLTQYGFMNTPKGEGPFPAVLVLHGYVNPATYRTPYGYTQRYADNLARQGFLVIHPDYRGHGRSQGESEGETNLFRTGYAIDVLNLIEHVKRLPNVKPDAIGLLGHSMGGGIAQRVIAVNPDVKAAVLYGSMSGDERLNTDHIKNVFRDGIDYLPEDEVPAELWAEISPINFLSDVTAAIEIHHGERDPQVPVAWSRDLNEKLVALGKDVTLFEYPRAGHSLRGNDYTVIMQRVTAFFRRMLQ
jgi:dipeptidyl aminopeptidase/acylaminoacyl peptidase